MEVRGTREGDRGSWGEQDTVEWLQTASPW